MRKYAPYILFLLVSIFVVVLYLNGFGPVESAERALTDSLSRWTANSDRRADIALVRIDPLSIDTYGNWPWDHDLIADLTAAVASAEPSAVVLDFEIPEDADQESAGKTDILAGQLAWIKNAVLPYDIALSNFRTERTTTPDELFKNSITVDNPLGQMSEESSLLVRKVFLPAEKLLRDKPYLGFDFHRPDDDRILRTEPLIMQYEGYYYPSQALLAAAIHLGVKTDDIRVVEGVEIQIGKTVTIPIGLQGEMYMNFGEGVPFAQYSASEILADGFDFNLLKGKIVLIGLADANARESFTSVTDERISTLVVKANAIDNIINGNYSTLRHDLAGVYLAILFLLGGICAVVLPRVVLGYRMVILGGGLIVIVNTAYLVFSSYRMIIEPGYLALELILFMLASPLLDSDLIVGDASEGAKKKRVPKTDAKAISNPRPTPNAPINPAASEHLETRQVDLNALNVEPLNSGDGIAAVSEIDHQSISIDEAPTEVTMSPSKSAEPKSSKAASQPVAKSARPDQKKPAATTTSDAASVELHGSDSAPLNVGDHKNLGRYQVTGILGKGAMGTVYKGVDPAINRPVALKTIRLDFVTDPAEMAELRERLFREAQAAGKLSHPNIVTIYDVGSEGDLQYIAMEYLDGIPLEDLIKRKVRFNYRIIAQIITQICSALDYAHDKGIVHRDIKPANIMVLSDYRIKVMDYGIARVDSHSMTKTGIAMGTPNYISPEQLKGQQIDRRADLFSLGVVMYEMLLGRLPFHGENLSSLIYAIVNKEPDKPSTVKPQVPLIFDHIIGRALRKEPDRRYQKASEITNELADFVESFVTR